MSDRGGYRVGYNVEVERENGNQGDNRGHGKPVDDDTNCLPENFPVNDNQNYMTYYRNHQGSRKNRQPQIDFAGKERVPRPGDHTAHRIGAIVGYVFMKEVEEDQQDDAPGDGKGRCRNTALSAFKGVIYFFFTFSPSSSGGVGGDVSSLLSGGAWGF